MGGEVMAEIVCGRRKQSEHKRTIITKGTETDNTGEYNSHRMGAAETEYSSCGWQNNLVTNGGERPGLISSRR